MAQLISGNELRPLFRSLKLKTDRLPYGVASFKENKDTWYEGLDNTKPKGKPRDPDVKRANGLPAQNNPDPKSIFDDHVLIDIGGVLYDPSYGAIYNGATLNARVTAFEKAAVGGYGYTIGNVTKADGSVLPAVFIRKPDANLGLVAIKLNYDKP